MKPAAAPSTQEALAGLVERVTFHNAENGFCVLIPPPCRVESE
jgi:exodeoxyribonuclease V alpha subunit